MTRLIHSFILTALLLGACAAQTTTPSEPTKPVPKPAQKPVQPPSTTQHTTPPKPVQPVNATPTQGTTGTSYVVYSSGTNTTNKTQPSAGDSHATAKSNEEHHSDHNIKVNTENYHPEHPHETTAAIKEDHTKHHEELEHPHSTTSSSVINNPNLTNNTSVTNNPSVTGNPSANYLGTTKSTSSNYTKLVDLNTGSISEIDAVFSNRTGHHVIEARPYKEVRELLTRSIIPGEDYLAVKDLVTVGSTTSTRVEYPNNSLIEKPTSTSNSTSTGHSTSSSNNTHSEEKHYYKKIDLNKASTEAIKSVFGSLYGPRVIKARPYKEVHELLTRNIITEEKFHAVKERLTVDDSSWEKEKGQTQSTQNTQAPPTIMK